MHDWAAVNGWSRLEMKTAPMSLTGLSRPTTKMSQGYGRYSVNIPVITPLPRSGLRRCHTTMLGQAANMQKQQVFKPHKHFVDSSTSHYIRYLKCSNQESEQKLKRTVHVLSMQRSKSDLDTSRETLLGGQGFNLMGGSVFEKKSPMVHNQFSNLNEVGQRDSGTFGGKQEMKVGVAVIPRKGLISLSTTESQEDQTDNLKMGDNRRQSMMGPGEKPSVKRQKTLIKRQDILEHIQMGVKRLEIEEQQQQEQIEMAKSLGDYTIMDLQSKIIEMTDAKSVHRPSPELDIAPSDLAKKKPTISKQEKITLPAIKNINPFTMKT